MLLFGSSPSGGVCLDAIMRILAYLLARVPSKYTISGIQTLLLWWRKCFTIGRGLLSSRLQRNTSI